MPNLLWPSLATLVASALLQSADVRAESFEVFGYTPPAGWQLQSLQDGRAYVRSGGTGVITFSASSFDNPDVAFAVTWRELVEPVVPGPAPTPQTQREGDFTVASGHRQAQSTDNTAAVALITVTGRGRRYAIVGMAGNDQALRELTSFLETVALTPAASAPAPGPTASHLVGRWWKSAGISASGNIYYWYNFTDDARYVWETPFHEPRTGTFQVHSNRITFTESTGQVTSHAFNIQCVGGRVYLEVSGEAGGYWHSDRRC